LHKPFYPPDQPECSISISEPDADADYAAIRESAFQCQVDQLATVNTVEIDRAVE
jgi:hypothetical protein